MSRFLLYGSFLVLLFSNCRRDNNVRPSEIEGRWKMVSVKDKANSQIILPPAGDEGKVYIVFSGNSFSGRTIRNMITGGTFQLKNSTDLSFGTFATTDAREDDWGKLMQIMLGACLIQSVAPCKPSIISRPSPNLLSVDLPVRYTIVLEKF